MLVKVSCFVLVQRHQLLPSITGPKIESLFTFAFNLVINAKVKNDQVFNLQWTYFSGKCSYYYDFMQEILIFEADLLEIP